MHYFTLDTEMHSYHKHILLLVNDALPNGLNSSSTAHQELLWVLLVCLLQPTICMHVDTIYDEIDGACVVSDCGDADVARDQNGALVTWIDAASQSYESDAYGCYHDR